MNKEENLKGWDLIDFVAQSMSQDGNKDYFKSKLVESIESQNINIENVNVEVLRSCALKILSQSLSHELLS